MGSRQRATCLTLLKGIPVTHTSSSMEKLVMWRGEALKVFLYLSCSDYQILKIVKYQKLPDAGFADVSANVKRRVYINIHREKNSWESDLFQLQTLMLWNKRHLCNPPRRWCFRSILWKRGTSGKASVMAIGGRRAVDAEHTQPFILLKYLTEY